MTSRLTIYLSCHTWGGCANFGYLRSRLYEFFFQKSFIIESEAASEVVSVVKFLNKVLFLF